MTRFLFLIVFATCISVSASAQGLVADFAGGNVLFFDGETVLGRAVENLPSGDAERTLAIIFRIREFQAEEVFLGGYGAFGEFGRSYHLGTSNGRLFFSQWGQAILGPELKSGVWYEAVVNSRAGAIRLFLNGCLEGSGELAIDTPPKSDFVLGRLPGPNGQIRRLSGEIAGARVYDRALEPSEIKSEFVMACR